MFAPEHGRLGATSLTSSIVAPLSGTFPSNESPPGQHKAQMTTTTADSSAESPPQSTRRLLRGGLFVAGMVAVTLYLVSSSARSSPGGALEDFYALALIWVTAVPTFQFLVSPRKTLPFFAAICVVYGVYFGLPRFNDRPLFGIEPWEPPPESVGPALAIALLGVSMLVVGFHVSGPLLNRIPRVTQAVDLRAALSFFLICSSISVGVRLVTPRLAIPGSLGQVLMVVQFIGEICMGGILLAQLRGLLLRWQTFFLIGLIFVQVLSGILTGLLLNGMWPVIGLLFVYAWERRRLPVALLLVAGVIFVPLNAAKAEFRMRYGLRVSDVAGQTSFQRAGGFASALGHTLDRMTVDEMLQTTNSRLGQLATMAVVVYQTPSQVPYWNGYSYKDLWWHLVPRLLVPGKPSASFGQEFPRRYGLIDYQDADTAFNFPQLVECYANFGVAGVAIGMMIIGILYRLLDHLLVVNTGGVLIAGTLCARLLNVESDFAGVFGGIPLFVFVLYGFIRLLPSEPNGDQ